MIVLISTCITAVLTYTFVRRLFWLEDETRDAVRWFGRVTWQVATHEDLQLSRQYMIESRRAIGVLTGMSWLGLVLLLANQ